MATDLWLWSACSGRTAKDLHGGGTLLLRGSLAPIDRMLKFQYLIQPVAHDGCVSVTIIRDGIPRTSFRATGLDLSQRRVRGGHDCLWAARGKPQVAAGMSAATPGLGRSTYTVSEKFSRG